MLIDTHAHLDFENFDADREAVIKRAQAMGVEKIVNFTSYARDFDKVRLIAKSHKLIWHSAGLHPHDTAQLREPHWLARVESLAHDPKTVVIGEIGLDYFQMRNTREEQRQLFVAQLDLAKKLHKPVTFHIRDAYDDVYDMVKDRRIEKAVVHCFSGTVEWAQKFLDLGYLLSFTGNITFPKTEKLAEVIKTVPLEKIMVETDAPFLAPRRVRGQRCEPAFVKDVAEKIAEIKGVSLEEVARVTTANAERFFDI
jgi:TatD DNase family protein